MNILDPHQQMYSSQPRGYYWSALSEIWAATIMSGFGKLCGHWQEMWT